MLTRCPHCQTAFRITPEQLTPRQGKVRCGSCLEVFNALESLSDETILRVPVQPERQADAAPVKPALPEESIPPAAPTPWPFPTPQALPEPDEPAEATPALPPASDPTPATDPAPETATPSEAAAAIPVTDTAPPPEPSPPAPVPEPALPDAWAEAADLPPSPPSPRRWPWLVGSLLLLLLAAIQLLYGYRVELAVLAPELRTPLTAACEIAGCSVPYPCRPELVAIESSDLVPDNERLHLTATLKNRAPFAQEWPHLELTLTDTRDQPILRKVLAPREFLPADKASVPFGVRDELAVSLWLETPGLQPVGYRLYLFYP